MAYMFYLAPSFEMSAPNFSEIEAKMLPPKLDGDSDDMETEPGSSIFEGESFHSYDDDAFSNFDHFFPGGLDLGYDDDAFSNFDYFFPGGLDLETLEKFTEVIEDPCDCESPTFREAETAMPDACVRPAGCPVDPCRIISDLTSLKMKTHQWTPLPSIPENEPMFVPTPRMPWWKYCFGIDAEETSSDFEGGGGLRKIRSTRDVRV
jgi:hypothetical protein